MIANVDLAREQRHSEVEVDVVEGLEGFILLLFAGLLVSVLLELIWYASDELGLLR